MGIMDQIFGRDEDAEGTRRTTAGKRSTERSADEQALARYRYMLQTAPPETIEQAHAEAFARLTPEQRQMVLQELTRSVPEAERATAAANDPQSLARLATRAEVRQPGFMERTFGSVGGGGVGLGGMMAGSFLSSIAGVVVGSAIAQSFFGDSGLFGGAGSEEEGGGADANANEDIYSGDAATEDGGDGINADDGGDFGGGDFEL